MLVCVLIKAIRRVDDLITNSERGMAHVPTESVPSIKADGNLYRESPAYKSKFHNAIMRAALPIIAEMSQSNGTPITSAKRMAQLPGFYSEGDDNGNSVSVSNPMSHILAHVSLGGNESDDSHKRLHELSGAIAKGLNQDSVAYIVPRPIGGDEDGNGTYWHTGRPFNQKDMDWMSGEIQGSQYKGNAMISDHKGVHTLNFADDKQKDFRDWLARKFDEKYGDDNDFSYQPYHNSGSLAYASHYDDKGYPVGDNPYKGGTDEEGNTAGGEQSPLWTRLSALKDAVATAGRDFFARNPRRVGDESAPLTSHAGAAEKPSVVVVKGFRGRFQKPANDARGVQGGR